MHKPMNERLPTLICTAAAVALATGGGLSAPARPIRARWHRS